ncbi:MAG: nucleoside triphosphate pyrophosphohydrolase [bacterium]|nr:nucleoside triphosphate pyrophosphohydrolase [bacterium]
MGYKKLVRDKIPEIIMRNGDHPITRILNNDNYIKELNIKLKEECEEYLSSGEVEELADLEEVLRAILKTKKVTYEEFEKIRLEKVEKRGAFEKRIYLEGVEKEN